MLLHNSPTMACSATFKPAFWSSKYHYLAFQSPSLRQSQPRHQRSNRAESLELHALFRPDEDAKNRTPLLRTSTTNRSNHQRVNSGKNGIKISGAGHKQVATPSSVDKMRLDLMRSDLSIKIAEDRAKKLEKELIEMTKKYNWAQSALRDRAATSSSRHPSTVLKGRDLSSQVQSKQRHLKKNNDKPKSQLQPKLKSVKGKKIVQNRLHTAVAHKGGENKGLPKKNTPSNSVRPTSAPKSSYQGNSIDDLPPFAAGLFANAEREEKKRRLKLGLIGEADLEELSLSQSDAPHSANSPKSPPSSSPSSIESLPPMAAGLFEQAERIEMERRVKKGIIEESEQSISVSDDIVHDKIDIDDIPIVSNMSNSNITIDETKNVQVEADTEVEVNIPAAVVETNTSVVDSNFTTKEKEKFKPPLSINTSVDHKRVQTKRERKTIVDVIAAPEVMAVNSETEKELLSLRKQCAILSHKLSRSEELRRAQTDELKTSLKSEKILRGLNSDWTRRMSDARKEMDEEKAEWNKEFEEKKQSWEEEKKGLEERVKVMECENEELQLLLESHSNFTFVVNLFCDMLKEKATNKMLHTRNRLFPGYAKTSLARNETNEMNETQSFVFSSPNLSWRRLRYGKKAPNRMLTVGGATEQRVSRASGTSRVLKVFTWARGMGNKSIKTSIDNESTSQKEEEENPLPPSSNISPPPGLEPIAPLLVTKKRRLPKLYAEKKSTRRYPTLVPQFLRKGK